MCARARLNVCVWLVLQWWWWCDFLHPLSLSRKTSLYIKHLLSFSFCDKYNFVSFIETYHLKHDEWDLNNFLSYTFLISRPTSFDTAEFTIWVNVKFNDTSVFVCLELLQYGRVDLIHFRVVIVSYCFLNYNLQLEYTFIHQIKTNVAWRRD